MTSFARLWLWLRYLPVLLALVGIEANARLEIPSIRRCGYVFQEQSLDEFGQPDPNYEYRRLYDEKKSVVLPDVSTLDQRGYGCCWITAYLGYSSRVACSTTVKNFRPSDTFLAAASIYERAMNAIGMRQTLVQGGNTPYAVVLAEKYGAIPEGVWKPKLDFQAAGNGTLLLELINSKIVAYVARTESAHRRIVQALAADPKLTGEMLVSKILSSSEAAAYVAEKKKIRADIDAIFREYIGELPKSFVYEGKTYTPLEFGKEILPADMREMTLVLPEQDEVVLESLFTGRHSTTPSRNPKDPERKSWSTVLAEVAKQAKWSDIDAAIETSLRANEPVLFGITVKRAFFDMKRGLISIDAFSRGRGTTFLEEIRAMTDNVASFTEGGHAMVLTGIYRNSEGRVVGYRVQNSWGDKGENGYFFVDANYMRTFSPNFFLKKGKFKPSAPGLASL